MRWWLNRRRNGRRRGIGRKTNETAKGIYAIVPVAMPVPVIGKKGQAHVTGVKDHTIFGCVL